ncbi:MAG: DUF4351 domain-containing protein [Schlesneria sp.]
MDNERQDSDYDGAWKELLRSHLRESLEDCFPEFVKLVNWDYEPEWLDKEISQVIGQSGHRNRQVDLLFKVRLLDGRDQWILCHLEIQTSYEADFEFRIDQYNSGLKWMFRRDVLTLVILADLSPDWRPTVHHFEMGGFESLCRFPICKILDRLSADWVGKTPLVAQVSRAQIAALKTAGNPEGRFSAKTQLVRNLYTLGYSSDRIRELFRLIDWMMRLPSFLDRRFKADLVAYEEEMKMPYVTSVERLAKEEGLEEGLEKGREEGFLKGREQGSATLLLRQLTRLCGLLSEEIEQEVRTLTLEQSQNLGEALLDFQSLEDLKNWLKTK